MMKTNWVQKNIGKRIWGQKILKWEEKKICQKILQKNCLSKKIVPEKIFDQKNSVKKNLGPKRFWSRKMGGPKISVQKNVRSKKCKARKILVQKFVCVQNILSKNFKYIRIWIQKNFWSTKKIWDQKNSGPKKWGAQKYQYRKI